MLKKRIVFLIIFITAMFVYFSFPVITAPDSAIYHWLTKVIVGEVSFENWNNTRGPVMPIILAFANVIFKGPIGFLIVSFVFYLIALLFGYKIIKELDFKNKIIKIITALIFTIFIIFNPLVIGYYHAMLTEFVAATIALITCYFSYKYVDVDIRTERRKFIFITILFLTLTIVTWFLKQPYVITVLSPVLIAIILSIIKNPNKTNISSKALSLLGIVVILIFSIKIWDHALEVNNVNIISKNTNSSFLSDGLLKGIANFRLLSYTDNYDINIIKNLDISISDKEEIERILNKDSIYKDYLIFNVLNHKNDQVIETVVLYKKEATTSFDEAIRFYFNHFKKHPILFAEGYLANYLGTINIYQSFSVNPGKDYYPTKRIGNYNHENYTIGLGIAILERTMLCREQIVSNEQLDYFVNDYDNINDTKEFLKNAVITNQDLFLNIFKLVFLIAPFVTLFAFISFIKYKRKENSKTYELLIILFGFSTLQVFFHSFFGLVIDRYAFPAFPCALIGTIILFKLIDKAPVIIEQKKEKILNEKEKILFVIPAYNESQNIKKVLDEIKKDMPKADVVVINDCSIDNTKEIVEKEGIKCITEIFNVGYSMAVQTGIKYAYQNGYNILIQFDGDGQHIVKEVNKLIKKYKECNYDIVIGSRFIEETGYKHSFFRKIGTKILSSLIKSFTGQTISDPTSGFQLLNQRIIERYAIMGNYPEYPDANLIIEVLLEGYTIGEVGVQMRQREFGESMHSGIIKPIKYMIKMIYIILTIGIRNIGKHIKKGN